MHLDIVTLMTAGSFVAALGGLLLTGAWTQIRREPAEEHLAQMNAGAPGLLEVAPDAGMNEGKEIAPSDSFRRRNNAATMNSSDRRPRTSFRTAWRSGRSPLNTRIADEAPSQQ